MSQQQFPKSINNNQFVVKRKISQGSFGVVYLGYDLRTSDQVAIKIEKPEVDELLSIEREISVLRVLYGMPQVPRLKWAGKENGHNIMVIQLLGRDLTHYIKHRKRFSLQCVLAIADQLLQILENIHNKGVIHRDLKPENILVGRENEQETLYLVDYGIAKQFKDETDKHIPFRENKPFLGTSRYASIAAHKGHELSRKDDLESLGYVLIYLLKGTLPWQNIKYKSEDEKVKLVGFMKMRINAQELCKDLPTEFSRFIDLVKKMSFREKPDYKYFQQLFRKLAIQQNMEYKFDWTASAYKAQSDKKTGSNSPRKRQVEQPPLLQQIYSPVKKQSGEDFNDEHSSNRRTDQKNSIIINSLIPERISQRQKSTSSFNDEQYSEQAPEQSVMVAFQRPVRFGSFHGQSELAQQTRNNNRSVGQRITHKLSLDIRGAQQNSVAEINLKLIRQRSIDENQKCESQLNEDESPSLDTKCLNLQKESVENSYKNPFQLNRISFEMKKRKRQECN